MKLQSAFLVAAIALGLSACASQSTEDGIAASERHECQNASPQRYDECMQDAEKGTVMYQPEGMQVGQRKYQY